MKKVLKKYSLARDYFIIFAVILAVITLLSMWYTWSVYSSRENIKSANLYNQNNRIVRELTSSFDYVSHLMKFMGEQILQGNPNNLERIAEMLQGKLITGEAVREQFSWAMFDWSRADKKIIVSTPYGVMKKPIDISNRYYAQMAQTEPWVLHLDPPDIGVTSGQWIIPAGMGIADINGNFIGTISMGFNVSKLSQNIEKVIDTNEISFVILDKDYNIVLHSMDNTVNTAGSSYFKSNLKDVIPESGAGRLPDIIEYGNIQYSYYSKVDGYPYTILTGYNKVIAAKEFNEILFPGITGYTIIGITALLLLIALRVIIIKPVINLSEMADKISRGEYIRKPKIGHTYETRNLAVQLLKVQNLIKREQKAKENHAELISIIKDADREKEVFLREMNHALREPLNAIINGADITRKEMLGSLCMDIYGDYLDAIYDAGKQLETYTTDFLNPSKVNVKDIIDKCVIIKKRHAIESDLQLIADIENNIPDIWADKLRLRQIILSTVFHSMSYTLPEGVIKLSAIYNDNPSNLIITIQDNGLGLNEEQRIGFWKKQEKNPSSYTRNPEMDRLSTPIIRHIVDLHHGKFEIDAVHHKGTTFTITLPYLKKRDLETNPDDFRKNKEKIKEETVDNIITFPGKK